jgi:hypothetical protein
MHGVCDAEAATFSRYAEEYLRLTRPRPWWRRWFSR